jgi:hypothetical protein
MPLKENAVSKKEVVQIASRAIALYLVFWSLGQLTNVPALAFAISHYGGQGVSAANSYSRNYYVIQLYSHIVMSIGLLLAAVWVYRCGPQIEAFLAPAEKS